MKLGIFGNIFGDGDRLNRLLSEFERRKVDTPISTGCLLRNYKSGEDLDSYTDKARYLINRLEDYRDGQSEDKPMFCLGYTERDFLEKSFDGSGYTNRLAEKILAEGQDSVMMMSPATVYNIAISPFMTEMCNGQRLDLSSHQIHHVGQSDREKPVIILMGNTTQQKSFEIVNGILVEKNRLRHAEPGKRYVICPSDVNAGSVIIDSNSIEFYK